LGKPLQEIDPHHVEAMTGLKRRLRPDRNGATSNETA
jgi:hypothetical protein